MFSCYCYNLAVESVSTKAFSLLHKIKVTKSNNLSIKPVMDSMISVFKVSVYT